MQARTCSSPGHTPDWKAYALGELDAAAAQSAESHAAACQTCRQELATLRLTLDSLGALREEEVPRRIAFVSDKVFEPRWWHQLWSPNFAAACVVAAAILVHAFAGRAPSEELVQARIDAAVTEAVAVVEARQEYLAGELRNQDRKFNAFYMQSTGLVSQ